MTRAGYNSYSSTKIVIIPTLNEELGIRQTIMDLKRNLNEFYILVVDGNSTDRTAETAKDFGADVTFQEGKGKGDALAQGFKQIGFGIEYVVLIDADYTYPAEYIPHMVRILDDNPLVGMVCGNRLTKRPDSEVLQTRFFIGNRLLAFVHNTFNGISLRDPLTGLRVVRTSILSDWVIKSKGFDIEVELNCQVKRSGYHIVEVPIEYRKRVGNKKLALRHGVSILKRILTESI
ncbi:MAG: glycosyltransferase family 2 protein [Candidatus Bathyarchaeia archaeon]|jgi:dolichol-phosphate mannosyltransferase